MPTYDHAFTIAFSIKSQHEKGDDISPQQYRNDLARLASLCDDELLEAVGMPFDSFVVETAQG